MEHRIDTYPRIAGRRRTRSGGFTLIEILTVVGIIAILVAISVLAYRTVHRVSAEQVTKTTMENLKAMVTAYQLHYGAAGFDRLYDSKTFPNGNVPCPGLVTLDMWNASTKGTNDDRYNSTAVQYTMLVMKRLMTLPETRDMLSKIPAQQRLPIDPNANSPKDPDYDVTPYTGDAPVLLDGWGNPIIFVPGTTNNKMYQGALVYTSIDKKGKSITVRVTSPDRQPFWVSAGPNGKFADDQTPGASDNVYSFNN